MGRSYPRGPTDGTVPYSGGQLCGWSDDNTPQGQEAELLRNAKLGGLFPSPLPIQTNSHDGGFAVDWELCASYGRKRYGS